ncbi:hypothetical protein KL933_001861 [Ogataea haglerorum]|uniref:Uncharacterized protein n=1 Tax=Ogataea haglerorum TaxID=1937702 RepID=A0AAN6D6Y7_9ASCO|nr:hypothetical protein KL933_001861 [Ogataea haglerorum]
MNRYGHSLTYLSQSAPILVPSVGEQNRAVGAFDIFWVFEHLVRQIRERLPDRGVPGHGFAERIFLAVACVEEVVCREQQDKAEGIVRRRPLVLLRVVVVQVQSSVAVRVWHAGDVPEDEHEAELFVRHVPGRHDELLALGARVGVQIVGQQHEHSLGRHGAVLLVLFETHAVGEEEQRVPRQSDLEEHFQVDEADSRVERSTHEHVVQVVAGHSEIVLGDEERPQVEDNGEAEAGDDGTGHDFAEIVEDVVDFENVQIVQQRGQREGDVERGVGVAEVRQLLAVSVRKRLALCPDSWQSDVEQGLNEHKRDKHKDGRWGRRGVRFHVMCHFAEELGPRLAVPGPGRAAVVEAGRDPHVVHQRREAHHHGNHARRPAKLPFDVLFGQVLWFFGGGSRPSGVRRGLVVWFRGDRCFFRHTGGKKNNTQKEKNIARSCLCSVSRPCCGMHKFGASYK